MKRFSTAEIREGERRLTVLTVTLFLAVVPFLGFYLVVNMLDRRTGGDSALREWIDVILGRTVNGEHSKSGLVIMVVVYGLSYVIAYHALGRLQGWWRRRHSGLWG